MSDPYVHGYNEREAQRLGDQAGTLAELLHAGDPLPGRGQTVLEAGCGIGLPDPLLGGGLARRPASPAWTSRPSHLAAGRGPGPRKAAGKTWSSCGATSTTRLWHPASFDHLFVCFVLEHLTRPVEALAGLAKPGQARRHGYGHRGRPRLLLLPSRAARGPPGLAMPHRLPGRPGGRLAHRAAGVPPHGLGGHPGRDGETLGRCTATHSRPAWVEGFVRLHHHPHGWRGCKEQALAAKHDEPGRMGPGHCPASPNRGRRRQLFSIPFSRGVGRAAAS